jgi:hypothetical protein
MTPEALKGLCPPTWTLYRDHMPSFTTTLTRDDDDLEVEVEYTFSKGCRGARDSLGGKAGAGPPLEPDEPDEVEIDSVTDEKGTEVDLTNEEITALEEKCLENYESIMERYYDN